MRHSAPARRSRRRGWAGAALLGAAAAGLVAFRAQLEPVAVAGGSMLPALPPGTLLAVGPVSLPLRRGRLVVVRPAAPAVEMVKRVVGLPGEHVRLDGGRLLVDGRPVAEPYLGPGTAADDFELRLGMGEYLVLGDRRTASTDGRSFGPVTAAELRGVVKFAYWPPRVVARRAIATVWPEPGSRAIPRWQND
jgi:signal peptidase I